MTRRRAPASGPGPDARLVRRAAAVVAAQTAGAVAVVVAVVAGLAFWLTVREQRMDAERTVQNAAVAAEDVTDPPPGVVLVMQRNDGRRAMSPDAPPELVHLDATRLAAGPSQWNLPDGRHYELYVYDRGPVRTVAALDLRYRGREADQLLGSLIAASAAGIAAAAALAWFVGRRAVRPLAAALALQRRFVADASHELRTPLTILHTRAQLLRRRAGEAAGMREELDRLMVDTRGLTEIVNDLLLSAQLPHRPDAHQRVDLADVARDVASSFTAHADQAGVRMTVHTDGGATTVTGIAVALRRAVSALVDNALGHTGAGGQITLSVAREGSVVRLAVADDGEGLDPRDAAALTERFARGANSPGPGRRFGLGLALVREVVHAHGGTLTLDGRPGAGATATVAIPAATG